MKGRRKEYKVNLSKGADTRRESFFSLPSLSFSVALLGQEMYVGTVNPVRCREQSMEAKRGGVE